MKNPKNIQIPYELFKDILWVLESLETSNYDESFKNAFEGVLEGLQAKQKSLEKRDIYSQLIAANKNGDKELQIDARIEYLKKRNTF